ncbi:MAG: HNH endonuclease, partial [Planctomycetota bacterium]
LGKGLFATVDAADYEQVRKYRWYVIRSGGNNAYAATCKNGKTVYMHRMLMRPRKGYVVDHIDGNGLNNRRCNLRVCTPAQNLTNKAPRGGSSQFVGVYRYRDKWVAHVTHRGKYYYVGVFADDVEAAKARDRKAYELHGQYAYLNFPHDLAR